MSDALTTTKPVRGKNGGARPGAGRKARSEIYKSQIKEAEEKIVQQLPYIVDDLIRRARGQYSETRLEMEPAGHLYRDDYEYYEVEMKGIIQQRYKKVKVRLYPDLPPDQMVITKHVETNFSPDYASGKYLMDRIMGPPQSISDEELGYARAALTTQQVAANFYIWQAEFLKNQAQGKAIENEQWPKQFVSEEEVEQKIQVLAASLNRPLLQMTPELWNRFKDSPNGLEEMKAYLGRSQAEVFAEVMESDPEKDSEEEEESEDE